MRSVFNPTDFIGGLRMACAGEDASVLGTLVGQQEPTSNWPAYVQTCAAGQLAHGIRVNSGLWLDGIGLMCQSVPFRTRVSDFSITGRWFSPYNS